jgi:methyl-accepting chemotaxis protein
MRSIKTQFCIFSAIFICAVMVGVYFFEKYTVRLQMLAERTSITQTAIENHLVSTFYNEEVRVLGHSALALYDFTKEEKLSAESSIKTYTSGIRELAASYGERSRKEQEKNLVLDIPLAVKKEMENIGKVGLLYHQLIDGYLTSPPTDKKGLIEAYAALNKLRSQFGDFRRVISASLEKEKKEIIFQTKYVSNQLNQALYGTIAFVFLSLIGFLYFTQRQLSSFGSAVVASIQNIRNPIPENLVQTKISEFRLVAQSIAQMQEQTKELDISRERELLNQESQKLRLATLEDAVNDFEGIILDSTNQIESSLSTMSQASKQLGISTETSSIAAMSFNENSEMTDEAVASVASASTEMATSVSHLAEGLRESLTMVSDANRLAQETDKSVEQMDLAARRIEEVVGLIRSIAEQTNLLALNATIEAARAGDVGRGFSVVAAEVKELATRTAQATDDIASQIAEIQKTSAISVTSIRTITKTMGFAQSRAAEMSAVLDQQESAIRGVAQSAENSLRFTRDMKKSGQSIAVQIASTRLTAETVDQSTDQVSSASKNMNAAVKTFLAKVAA